MLEHHDLDIHPIPSDTQPLFINEPWLIDASLMEFFPKSKDMGSEEDTVRVFVPLDLSKSAILRRLSDVVRHYGEATEGNESDFRLQAAMLVSQIEIYDQIWFARRVPLSGKHSVEARELVAEFVAQLEDISDGGAELFPFEMVEELRAEYLITVDT